MSVVFCLLQAYNFFIFRGHMATFQYIRIAVCLCIFFNLFFHPLPVSACSCVERGTLFAEFSQHDAIFTGKVLRIVDNYTPIYSTVDDILIKLGFSPYFFYKGGKLWGYSVFFNVIESWKGVQTTIVQVDTGYGMGDCGYSFRPDREYLIYASHAYGVVDDYWVTSICSRKADLKAANEDLNYLNSKRSLSLRYFLPILWTEKDSIVLALISLPFICVVILLRKKSQCIK